MRNKFLIPVITLTLLLTLASCTLAVNTISMNLLLNGESQLDNTDYDMSQLTLGLTVPVAKKISLGVELASGEIDRYGADGDTSSYRIKGAYKIFADQKVSLDLTGGIYHRGLEIPGYADYDVSSLTIGVDGRLKLDSKAWIDLGLALGLLPDEKLDEYFGGYYKADPDSLALFHLKFNYLVNKQFGLSLGYTSESYDSELLPRGNSHTGLNAGAFFRF